MGLAWQSKEVARFEMGFDGLKQFLCRCFMPISGRCAFFAVSQPLSIEISPDCGYPFLAMFN
jgi:hypothetical protein